MSEKVKYDFGGYVTKHDLKCTDGRIIRHGAFSSCDGARVPLVFMHNHRDMNNVLGFVDLECREDGVYGRGAFNGSAEGQAAKERVQHGDITQMSIYANQLKERAKEVYHGVIREVSLVLAGANPGAVIDNLNLVHSDGSFDLIDDEAIIKPAIDFEVFHADSEESNAEEPEDDGAEEKELEHADDVEHADEAEQSEETEDDETVAEVFDGMTDEQKDAARMLIGLAKMKADGEDIDAIIADAPEPEEGEPSLQEVLDSMTDKERNVVYFLVSKAVEEEADEDEEEPAGDGEMNQSDDLEEGENTMAHKNVFEQDAVETSNILSHDDMKVIFKDARACGSLKEAWLDFAAENDCDPNSLKHSITNIGNFFPEAQAVQNQPSLISRRMEWVDVVLTGVHKTPFSKVKSMAANLTADQARAKGYIKGHQKIEEQITALKRVTSATTIYKLQKLDRDDVIEITDFDVVAWIKAEMRMMLNEECARAYLIGDGRLPDAEDKIDETCIRPIWTDDEVYAIHSTFTLDGDPQETAKAFIDAAIRAKKNYKGSGSPTLFVGPTMLTEMRLIKDEMGHRIYKNDQELADELRVSKIVEVEPMDNKSRVVSEVTRSLGGIIVNLLDYNVGTNRGGEVTLFDDFDLNYNKLEFLIETRQSGALVQPASALVLEGISA